MDQQEQAPHLHLVACGVFRAALAHLDLQAGYPELRLTWLPSILHLRPAELRAELLQAILALPGGASPICLYGDCFPGSREFFQERKLQCIAGAHCYEILLGPARYEYLMRETAGTYFAEKELLENFEEYCVQPLELDDPEMRHLCFRHYERFVYVRQPADPDLLGRAHEVAAFLGLSVEVREADYSYLEQHLRKLIEINRKQKQSS